MSSSDSQQVVEAEPRPRETGRRGRALIVVPAVAAGVLIGILLPPALQSSGILTPISPQTLQTFAPGLTLATSSVATGAFGLLERPQEPTDLPSEATIAELDYADVSIDSLRRIELNPSIAAPAPVNSAYVGRDTSSRICVLLIDSTDEFAMSCVTEAQFRISGAKVTWTTSERLELGDPPQPAIRGLTLGPDGSFSSTLSTRYQSAAG